VLSRHSSAPVATRRKPAGVSDIRPRMSLVLGAPTAEIVAACSGEGCTWRERLVVYWSKGMLSVRSKATGERCDG